MTILSLAAQRAMMLSSLSTPASKYSALEPLLAGLLNSIGIYAPTAISPEIVLKLAPIVAVVGTRYKPLIKRSPGITATLDNVNVAVVSPNAISGKNLIVGSMTGASDSCAAV